MKKIISIGIAFVSLTACNMTDGPIYMPSGSSSGAKAFANAYNVSNGYGYTNYTEYAWDGFYDAYGNFVYRCREVESGKFAENYNCKGYKNDNTWPSR